MMQVLKKTYTVEIVIQEDPVVTTGPLRTRKEGPEPLKIGVGTTGCDAVVRAIGDMLIEKGFAGPWLLNGHPEGARISLVKYELQSSL